MVRTKPSFVGLLISKRRELFHMKIDRSITLFLNYCRSKQLRPKTLQSYEQTLALFAKWLRESERIKEVEEIREITI